MFIIALLYVLIMYFFSFNFVSLLSLIVHLSALLLSLVFAGCVNA